MAKKDLLLELFSGTGSVGKAAKKAGFKEVISIDLEEKFNPTIVADLLKLDYKKLPTPDFIWASPPCTAFSVFNHSFKQPHIDYDTMKPLTETGVIGLKLLARTLTIIKYFKKKNPNLKFVIENPRGYMRRMKSLSNFIRTTTAYGQYGFSYRKPTDFWSNFELNLKEIDEKKTYNQGVADFSRCITYRIPQPLLKQIFKDYSSSK